MEKYPVDMPDVLDRSYEKDIINQKYDFIEEILDVIWVGGTDAGIIHKSVSGVRTTSISAPIRYIHSPASVACVSDIEDMLKLARLFLENWEV